MQGGRVKVEAVRVRLRHVRWLGGGSGAGKSTIARRLAARHGLHLYATDDVMTEHACSCHPADCPYLQAFAAMTMDERWLARPPQVMVDTFHWFRGESFDLIIEDLLRLPEERVVLVEGFRRHCCIEQRPVILTGDLPAQPTSSVLRGRLRSLQEPRRSPQTRLTGPADRRSYRQDHEGTPNATVL